MIDFGVFLRPEVKVRKNPKSPFDLEKFQIVLSQLRAYLYLVQLFRAVPTHKYTSSQPSRWPALTLLLSGDFTCIFVITLREYNHNFNRFVAYLESFC